MHIARALPPWRRLYAFFVGVDAHIDPRSKLVKDIQ